MEETQIVDCSKCKHLEEERPRLSCDACSAMSRTCLFESRRKRVAIFGGAFNPVTNSHFEIATEVLNTFYPKDKIDEVWIMPCFKHRFGKDMASYIARLDMLHIAWENYSGNLSQDQKKSVVISEFEYENKIEGGTYITLKALQEKYPEIDFSFVIGSDNALTIEKWANYEKLLNETRFIIFNRETPDFSYEYDLHSKNGNSWFFKEPHFLLYQDCHISPFSSTQARVLISLHRKDPISEETLRKLLKILPNGVYQYIMYNGLYLDQ